MNLEEYREKITSACYAMQSAYQQELRMHDAISKVQKSHQDLTGDDLEIMWRAIDAYVDINTTT